MVLECTVAQSALLKILAHGAKFPASAVNGVLLGTSSDPSDIQVLDVVPLCHTQLALAPAIELGLSQVEGYTQESGKLQMVGYYQSDSRFAPGDLTPVGRKIADKIYEKQPASVVLVMDNKKLGTFCSGTTEHPFELFNKDGSKGWKRAGADQAASLQLASGTWKGLLEEFFTMYKQQKHKTLFDFEEHLDDISKDYLNKEFTKQGKLVLPGQGL